MSFHVRHRWGANVADPSSSELDELLAELYRDLDDEEHPSVSLTHESEWNLEVYLSGRVVLENLEDEDAEPQHLSVQEPRDARPLLVALSEGRLADLFSAPWKRGHGPD